MIPIGLAGFYLLFFMFAWYTMLVIVFAEETIIDYKNGDPFGYWLKLIFQLHQNEGEKKK